MHDMTFTAPDDQIRETYFVAHVRTRCDDDDDPAAAAADVQHRRQLRARLRSELCRVLQHLLCQEL